MAIADRIAINASNVIYYDSAANANDHGTSTAEYFTVIQLHRFLQDLADDAVAAGDDLIDITSVTPSDRSTDNIITVLSPYTMDDGTVGGGDPVWEHLYDGSIIQASNNRTWDGLVVIAAEGMDLQIIQNGDIIANDFWNLVPDANRTDSTANSSGTNSTGQADLVTTDGTQFAVGDNIIISNDIDEEYRIVSIATDTLTLNRNLVTAASASEDIFITVKGLNRDTSNGISHRFMLETINSSGNNIDGRRIIGMTRVFGKTYSEFKVNGTARGNNVLALTYADDLNDTTDASGRTTITNTEGYQLLTMDGTNSDPFYSQWNLDSYTSKEFYERMKWLTTAESGDTDVTGNATIYGLDGNIFRGITHEIALNLGAGGDLWVEPEAVSWTGTNTGTGQLIAVDDTADDTATKMWIQLLTGNAPANGDTITGAAASQTCNGTPTERTISTPFCGQSTGSALIGSYGFGVEPQDTTASDLFRDLNNVTQQPPNNVTFTVSGVFGDEDRVLVGPEDGSGGLQLDQCEINAGEGVTVTAGSVSSATAGAGSIVFTSNVETIGTGTASEDDTPSQTTNASGSDSAIRVLGDDNIYHRVTYTGVTAGSGTLEFTGCASSGTWNAAVANNGFIGYIDDIANSTASAVNATTLVAGDAGTSYIIVSTGSTDFTAGGAADSDVGTAFVYDGTALSGTGTLKVQATSEAVTVVYNTDRSLFIRVRDGGTAGDDAGIRTFETTGTLGSGGGSTTAIRTSDV